MKSGCASKTSAEPPRMPPRKPAIQRRMRRLSSMPSLSYPSPSDEIVYVDPRAAGGKKPRRKSDHTNASDRQLPRSHTWSPSSEDNEDCVCILTDFHNKMATMEDLEASRDRIPGPPRKPTRTPSSEGAEYHSSTHPSMREPPTVQATPPGMPEREGCHTGCFDTCLVDNEDELPYADKCYRYPDHQSYQLGLNIDIEDNIDEDCPRHLSLEVHDSSPQLQQNNNSLRSSVRKQHIREEHCFAF